MPPGRTASCLIGGNTITKDFIIAHRILPLTAAITGISLDGIDKVALRLQYLKCNTKNTNCSL